MTSPEPARTPLAERLSPVPGPSGINLRPREGKNNVDVVSAEGEAAGKSKTGGRGGRVKKRGQAGDAGGSGRKGQQAPPPPSRGAREKRGGGKKVTFGNPPHHNHKDKSKTQAAFGRGGGGAGRYAHGVRKGPNPNAQSEAPNVKKDEPMTPQNRGRPRPPLRNRRASSFTEGHGKSGSGGTNTRHRWKYHGGRRSSSSNMNKTVLPSKFLLGGNIRDPLNLNSLADERISKIVNAITPESSPLPTPKHRKAEYKIEVLIPPNITDPLNLNSGVDENEYAATLASNNPVAGVRRKKFRYRKRVRSSSHKNAAAAAAAAAARVAAAAQAGSQSEPELASEKRCGVGDESTSGDDAATASAPKAAVEPPEFVSPPPAQQRQSAPSLPLKRPSTLRGPSPAKKVQKQSDAEIVSPVVPQPGQKKPVRKHHYHHKHRQERRRQQQGRHQQGRREQNACERVNMEEEGETVQPEGPPQPSRTKMNAERNRRFEFGNYSRYYGYRNPHREEDLRLKYLKPDWFRGKEVLDVGCNQGDVTCAIARIFNPKSIVGIDIDKSLIEAARKNVAHVASLPNAEAANGLGDSSSSGKGKSRGKGKGKGKGKNSNRFPQNVKFICGNYVLENDELLETIQPEFDVVVCFSTTKWIHLNFGDDGLKRAFKRMHAQLRPGGMLILEAQDFASYRKKKKLTERIFENFQNIKLRPENFSDYLLQEVGFCTGHTIAIPHHSSKGFQRPLQFFVKRVPFSSRSVSSRQTTPGGGYSSTFYNLPSPGYLPHLRTPHYAPTLTPRYNDTTPSYSPVPESSSKTPKSPSKSPRPSAPDSDSSDLFPRPAAPPVPGYSPVYAPLYSPSDVPTYSGYTPGQSGLTPGYSGPSPECSSPAPALGHHSPVYSGPPPGSFSNASTPGHPDADQPGYTPSYSPRYQNYTPSNPGTPASPGQKSPQFSPGNATPRGGGSTPGTPGPVAGPSNSQSPQIQQNEITGNSTPHPGPSGTSPAAGDNAERRYLWYGYSSGNNSSGGNTPQSAHENSNSPARVYPTHYADIVAPPAGSYSNPGTPASPATTPTHQAGPDEGGGGGSDSPRE